MKKRLAVVGFGKMGILHGALANALEGHELTAICERSKMVRAVLRKTMPRLAVFATHAEMIDTARPDAIIISTPTFSHAEPARYAAERGIGLFIEKPLTSDLASAESLAAVVAANRVPSMVGFSFRYFPTIAEGHRLLREGAIGKALSARAEMFIGDVFSAHAGWRYDPALSGGGALMDFGIHMVDMLVWCFGRVANVKATAKRLHSSRVEDEMTADIVFAGGLRADFATSWSNPDYRKASPKVHITGESGELIITEQTLDIVRGGERRSFAFPDLYRGDYIDIAGINYSLQMKAFAQVMAGGVSETDAAHGAYIQKVVDCMYRSAAANATIEVA